MHRKGWSRQFKELAQFEPTSNWGKKPTSVAIASFYHVTTFANIFTDFVSNPSPQTACDKSPSCSFDSCCRCHYQGPSLLKFYALLAFYI